MTSKFKMSIAKPEVVCEIDVDGKIILKLALKSQVWCCGLYSAGLGYSAMSIGSECSIEPADLIESGYFHRVRFYQGLRSA
jgi:hypothetical protein